MGSARHQQGTSCLPQVQKPLLEHATEKERGHVMAKKRQKRLLPAAMPMGTESDINSPLVESTRPPLYRAIKYWGKKPHNIWAKYIVTYCPVGGTVADPFAGSAVAAFEAVKAGRKAIAFDLNPLSSFIIEVTASACDVDKGKFLAAAKEIKESVEATAVYRHHYRRGYATVLNYRWTEGKVVAVGIDSGGAKRLLKASDRDRKLAARMAAIKVKAWHPSTSFPRHPSVGQNFIEAAGGKTIDHLWTKRNLYLLAAIFDKIRKVKDANIRLQLLSGFVQSLHLCSKMVIPRHTAANRDFSGSWGRPDYLIRRRQMEQNPVNVFWRSCAGRQGVLSMLQDAAATFPDGIDIHDAKKSKKIRASADINYGAIDVADLGDYLKPGDVDFIITDPPYAGLVRYLPLSVVWVSWLERIDKKYKPALKSEISVEPHSTESRQTYRLRLRNAFQQMYRLLPEDKPLVVTFHHKQIREFNDFILAAKEAQFIPDKVTHQYNRRSGESNVANPYGVSGSDFYVRLRKRRDINLAENPGQLDSFIVQKATEIIGRRNERTPYNFLFEALWPEVLQAGFTQPRESNNEIRRVLVENSGAGKIFLREENAQKPQTGDLWWFNDPAAHISHPDRPLHGRIAESVLGYLRRNVSVKLDDVIAELFREYPNGLTPDPRTVQSYLEQFAYRDHGKWKILPETIAATTRHSAIIAAILVIGSKMNAIRFVGRREQPEQTAAGEQLRTLADVQSLASVTNAFSAPAIERLEMVDVVFLAGNGESSITCLWEVENSTNFTSAIQRGSNADRATPKFMVIPDDREQELLRIVDPMFVEQFAVNNWRYLTYEATERLAGMRKPTLAYILEQARQLGGTDADEI